MFCIIVSCPDYYYRILLCIVGVQLTLSYMAAVFESGTSVS